MDKISVILPVYKVEKYIDQCMNTVLNQTYQNLEIILVDDGSPDNCGKICDEYQKKDARIKVIHKKNGGAPAARNDALKIATGDWIAYVDPDDWIEPEAFEEALKVGLRDNSDIVIFNTYINTGDQQREVKAFPNDFCTDDRKIIQAMQLSSLSKNYSPFSDNWSQGFPWDKIYRADFLKEHNVLWPINVKANDDVIYTIHAFQFARRISYFDRTFYHYRMNPESIGHKYMPDRVKVDHDIYVEMMRIKELYHLGSDYDLALYSRIMRNVWLSLGRCFFHPQNTKSLRQKLKDIGEMLDDEIISNAFKKAERDKMERRIRIMAMWKKPIWLYTVYRAYNTKESIKQKLHH